MKTWLKRHRRPLLALGILAIMGTVFSLGWYAGANATSRRAHTALWEAMESLPDPEWGALCGEDTRYHAPCLINLSTGQRDEMRVYTYSPSPQSGLDPREAWFSGTFHLQSCAGLTAIRDTCAHTCEVILPKEREPMDPALFCKACRQVLAGNALDGYAIVDLYDLDHVQAYPFRDETIRDYRISVTSGNAGVTVRVTGLLHATA